MSLLEREESIKVNGRIIKEMEKGNIYFQMDLCMKVVGKMIKQMAMVV